MEQKEAEPSQAQEAASTTGDVEMESVEQTPENHTERTSDVADASSAVEDSGEKVKQSATTSTESSASLPVAEDVTTAPNAAEPTNESMDENADDAKSSLPPSEPVEPSSSPPNNNNAPSTAATPAAVVAPPTTTTPTTTTPTTPTATVKQEPESATTTKRKQPSSPSQETPTDTNATSNGSATTTDSTSAQEQHAAKKQKVDTITTTTTTVATTATATSVTPATTTTTIATTTTAVPSTPSSSLMISRDDMAKMEEDGGMLKFDVITNDGQPEHMVQLTTLKNIFARQLPKMPREYIVRLVFDRNHRSMVILKNGKQVIGGICYRPFEANHFGEIAFCAINAADQVKGYGTRLMNHLKEYVKAAGITHFLTYADNYAIGYFKKQGFAKVVSMPRPNWFGYIKDYDGGTLMECTLHHQINYLRITSMVQQQRKKIQDKIKERSHADIMYPGLTKFAEGRTMDLYMIPGVQEAGWSRATIRNSRVGTRDPGSLKTQLQQLYKNVFSHRSSWPFQEPVDTSIVVDYLDYIKEPIDLTLIQKRIDSGHYLSKSAFKADLETMCANCMTYNTPDTNYYKAAKDLQEFIEKRVQVAK